MTTVNLLFPREYMVPANGVLNPSMPHKVWSHLNFGVVCALLALAFSMALVFNSNIRNALKAMIMPPYRVVVSIAKANLDGDNLQILKVKTQSGLYLEIYGASDPSRGGLQPLLYTSKLETTKDGYFSFNGMVTNLAIDDVDNDGSPEILASGFDENMVAHLSFYRWNKAAKSLEKFYPTGLP